MFGLIDEAKHFVQVSIIVAIFIAEKAAQDGVVEEFLFLFAHEFLPSILLNLLRVDRPTA